MLLLADDVQVVGIDEAQFFDEGIGEVVCPRNQGKRVVIAGLDKDFKGRPFGPMPNLLATAEYVTKLTRFAAARAVLHTSPTASWKETKPLCWANTVNTNR